MKGMDIYKSLGHISEEMVQEAEETTGKLSSHKWNWKHFTAMASSIALIFGLSLFFHQNGGSDGGMTGGSSGAGGGMSGSSGTGLSPSINTTEGAFPEEEIKTEYSLYFNKIDTEFAEDKANLQGYFQKEFKKGEIILAFPMLGNRIAIPDFSGTVGYWCPEDEPIFYQGDVYVTLENDGEAQIIFARNQLDLDYVFLDEGISSNIEGVTVKAGSMELFEDNLLYYAEFMLEDMAFQVEMRATDPADEVFTDLVAEIILGGSNVLMDDYFLDVQVLES